MTDAHSIRIGWAGYLRVAVCSCGWKGLPRKTAPQAGLSAAEHSASAVQTR